MIAKNIQYEVTKDLGSDFKEVKFAKDHGISDKEATRRSFAFKDLNSEYKVGDKLKDYHKPDPNILKTKLIAYLNDNQLKLGNVFKEKFLEGLDQNKLTQSGEKLLSLMTYFIKEYGGFNTSEALKMHNNSSLADSSLYSSLSTADDSRIVNIDIANKQEKRKKKIISKIGEKIPELGFILRLMNKSYAEVLFNLMKDVSSSIQEELKAKGFFAVIDTNKGARSKILINDQEISILGKVEDIKVKEIAATTVQKVIRGHNARKNVEQSFLSNGRDSNSQGNDSEIEDLSDDQAYQVAIGKTSPNSTSPINPETQFSSRKIDDASNKSTSDTDCDVTNNPNTSFFSKRTAKPSTSPENHNFSPVKNCSAQKRGF